MKITLITLMASMALFVSSFSATAQRSDYVYTPWSTFQNDTLAYLKKNFVPGPDYFGGYPVSAFLDRLELSVKGVRYRGSFGVAAIDFIFEDPAGYQYKELHEKPFILCEISVTPPHTNGSGGGGISHEEGYRVFGVGPLVIVPMTPEIRAWLSRLKISLGDGINIYR